MKPRRGKPPASARPDQDIAVPARVSQYIREHALLRPGARVGLAVSGGADSVAMLRVLVALREELGIVPLVAHFHHGIRGDAADADQDFVARLAAQHDLQFHCAQGDAPQHARTHGLTLEEAARELRLRFFEALAIGQHLQAIATAHSCDDQAETVLMKLIRGAGSRGLAGIFPRQKLREGEACLIRPLLCLRRDEIEAYLRHLGQQWRQDHTNADPRHTRNRVRSLLLPLLEREFNPAVKQALAHTAEIARAEEEYWQAEVKRLLPLVLLPGKPVRGGGRAARSAAQGAGLSLEALRPYPLAVQRRVVRALAESCGVHLDFEHMLAIEHALLLPAESSRAQKEVELPGGYVARRSFRELRFEPHTPALATAFEYELPVPGALSVPELGTVIRTSLGNSPPGAEEYNQPDLINLGERQLRLTVRSWRPGDRFRPAHSGSEKKLKELLQRLHVAQQDRAGWPVIAAGPTIVWVRGFASPPVAVDRSDGRALLRIEELAASAGGSRGV